MASIRKVTLAHVATYPVPVGGPDIEFEVNTELEFDNSELDNNGTALFSLLYRVWDDDWPDPDDHIVNFVEDPLPSFGNNYVTHSYKFRIPQGVLQSVDIGWEANVYVGVHLIKGGTRVSKKQSNVIDY